MTSKTDFREHIIDYIQKFQGTKYGLAITIPPWRVIVWTFVASFAGMASVAAIQYNASLFVDSNGSLNSLIGSFGATAVLLYCAIDSPLAQPRNVVLGHVISALIGVVCQKGLTAFRDPEPYRWLAASLSVSLSITAMQVTKTVHPPGGATALIATTGGPTIYALGFTYVLMPVMFGVILMLAVALVINNIERHYPMYWWSPQKPDKIQRQPFAEPVDEGEIFAPSGPANQGTGIVDQGADLAHHGIDLVTDDTFR
ncbi:HPP family protein [Gorgonomyces haynaldii]|nr:HPP family protein [Gorgonomyces haynaldii]